MNVVPSKEEVEKSLEGIDWSNFNKNNDNQGGDTGSVPSDVPDINYNPTITSNTHQVGNLGANSGINTAVAPTGNASNAIMQQQQVNQQGNAEAVARLAANNNAQTAQQIQNSGLAGQGMGVAMANETAKK